MVMQSLAVNPFFFFLSYFSVFFFFFFSSSSLHLLACPGLFNLIPWLKMILMPWFYSCAAPKVVVCCCVVARVFDVFLREPHNRIWRVVVLYESMFDGVTGVSSAVGRWC